MGRVYLYTETGTEDLVTIIELLGWQSSPECRLKEFYPEDGKNRQFCCSRPVSFKVHDTDSEIVVLNGNAGQFEHKAYSRITFDDDTTKQVARRAGDSYDQYELTETGKRRLADIVIRTKKPVVTDNLGNKINSFVDQRWIKIAKDKMKRCSDKSMTFSQIVSMYIEDTMNHLYAMKMTGDFTDEYVNKCAVAFDMFYNAQRFFNRKTIEAVMAVDPRVYDRIRSEEQFEAYDKRLVAALDMIHKVTYDPSSDIEGIILAKDPNFFSRNIK